MCRLLARASIADCTEEGNELRLLMRTKFQLAGSLEKRKLRRGAGRVESTAVVLVCDGGTKVVLGFVLVLGVGRSMVLFSAESAMQGKTQQRHTPMFPFPLCPISIV